MQEIQRHCLVGGQHCSVTAKHTRQRRVRLHLRQRLVLGILRYLARCPWLPLCETQEPKLQDLKHVLCVTVLLFLPTVSSAIFWATSLMMNECCSPSYENEALKTKKQGQCGDMTSEVYADGNGTISPPKEVFWFRLGLCLLCQCCLKPGFRLPMSKSQKEMQIPGPHPRHTESGSLGDGAGDLHVS